ncbi:amidohydrolase [Fluviicola sp.]|uniref:amidohydrolase n=1 Tax=Fluviicola sp. TaxID=1917219 RepID=UPI0031D562DF
MKTIISTFLLLLAIVSYGQKKYNKILIEGATLHIGNGNVIPTGSVGIENGTIMLVKNTLAYTYNKADWDTVITLNGHHLYPGFVAPNSTLGLTEIDAVRASHDFQELGTFNPHVRAQVAYNCESDVIETVRTNGVLMIQTTPRGGRISGQSSLMTSACWNWEDGTVKADDGIHIEWPSAYSRHWGEPVAKPNETYEEQKRELIAYLTNAKVSAGNKDKATPLQFSAMSECFNGEKRFYFHANEVQQINDILDLITELEIKFPVIVGGYESYLVADRLKIKKVPVMVGRLHSLPQHDDDAFDLPYKLPFLLQQAGVQFCLQNEGDMEAMNARNLPFLAGTAMSYGLTEEEAIRSITLSTCEIMGISKNYGSIEIGKKATLYGSAGSALEMKGNQASLLLINGAFVPTTNFQTELYRKYKTKYGK